MAALRDTFAAAFGKAGLSGAETAVIYEQSMSAGFGQSCRGYVLLRYLALAKAFPINTRMGILVDLEIMKTAVKDPPHHQTRCPGCG
jgi:thiosulfate/3-mercaptopyruvate sulfurtransferase